MGPYTQVQTKTFLTASNNESFGIEGALDLFLKVWVEIAEKMGMACPEEDPRVAMSPNEQCRRGTWREGKLVK